MGHRHEVCSGGGSPSPATDRRPGSPPRPSPRPPPAPTRALEADPTSATAARRPRCSTSRPAYGCAPAPKQHVPWQHRLLLAMGTMDDRHQRQPWIGRTECLASPGIYAIDRGPNPTQQIWFWARPGYVNKHYGKCNVCYKLCHVPYISGTRQMWSLPCAADSTHVKTKAHGKHKPLGKLITLQCTYWWNPR